MKIKFTREEAIKKCSGLVWGSPEAFIQALEAVGIVEFKEKPVTSAFEIISGCVGSKSAQEIVDGVIEAGYRIEKK